MPIPPDSFGSSSTPPVPPQDLLADIYRHLPLLVVHLTSDGIVLHCNPEASRITGYAESELVGAFFWGALFPGKLFAQVPKFISPDGITSPLLHDRPMTIRTKNGAERIIAFTRFTRLEPADHADTGRRTIVCIGVDLTDRLIAADGIDPVEEKHFGASAGNAGAIDGEVIVPIAISPPSPLPGMTGDAGGVSNEARATAEAIREAHGLLSEVESRMAAVSGMLLHGDEAALAELSKTLQADENAHRRAEFFARSVNIFNADAASELTDLPAQIRSMLTLYHKDAR